LCDKITYGKEFTEGISDRLEIAINQSIVDELTHRYNLKMKNIQVCDEKMSKN